MQIGILLLETMGNVSAVMQDVKDVTRVPGFGVTRNDVANVEPVSDPRSPTEQFTRTPIEVNHSIIRSTNTRSRISQSMESLGAVEQGSYDICVASTVNEGRQIRLISDDPRSPTPGIVRTPIQVFSPETRYAETDESRISASSENYETGDDMLFSMRDSSSSSLGKDLDSDSPAIIEKQPKTIADDVFVDKDVPAAGTLSCTSDKKQSRNTENDIRVKLFHTPPTKASDLKVRMPLRAFSANESLPQQILRAKHARGILESMDVENTPPKGVPDTWKRSVPSYLK